MQMIWRLVLRQFMRSTVQCEATVRDASCHSTGNRAKVRVPGKVVLQAFETEHHIRHAAIAIRDEEAGNDAAVRDHFEQQSVRVDEGASVHLTTIRKVTEGAGGKWRRGGSHTKPGEGESLKRKITRDDAVVFSR